jgi:aspartate aminotransferase
LISVSENLNALPDIQCFNPQGAFYLFPNVSAFFGRSFKGKSITNSSDLTEYILGEANCAVVPGTAFGNNNHIRISYATSMKNIEKSLRNIKDAIMKLD